MDKWILTAAVLCLLTAAAVVVRNNYRTKRTFARIEAMLNEAMEGRFSEKVFDESRLSALETMFYRYLSATEMSAKNMAAERDKIKTLISDISHQTKTPIANLLLYSEFLGESDLSKEQRSNVDAVHGQAEILRFLIDSLVKLSRLETGILQLSPREEPLQPMLESVRERFLKKAEEKGLALCLEKTDAAAVFDRKWTEEALGNLVDNAVKYTSSGEIVLRAVNYELFARIDVKDTGVGIAEEELTKIFARFYRSEAVREQEGVGIGLSLAREILSGEGGYIKVTSVSGKGSTFSVFLPR